MLNTLTATKNLRVLRDNMSFEGNTGDNEFFRGVALWQDNETFEEMQCSGFVSQDISESLLSWEWSASSLGDFPNNCDTFPFLVPASEPCSHSQLTYHPLREQSFSSSMSLIQESGPSSAFTEASPYSEAFGAAIQSGSDSQLPSALVQSPLGLNNSQQPIDTAEPPACTRESLLKSTQNDEDSSGSSYISKASRPEIRRPKTKLPRGTRRRGNAERSQVPSVAKYQQGTRTKVRDEKEVKKRIKLEQNPLAAAKCRNRKRDLANALNIEMEELSDRHQQLSAYCNQLRSKVIRLKTEVLRHSDCDCDFIRRYISAEASRTVSSLSRQDTARSTTM
ncbi:hypothetical protein SNK03_013061 [Fusarium graminearum]